MQDARENINVDDVLDGFYRIKWGKKYLPVAIWTVGDVRNFRVFDRSITDEFKQHEMYLRCEPCPRDHVQHAFENNGTWPNDAIGYEVDVSEEATPAPPPEPVKPPDQAVSDNATARAQLLGMIKSVEQWAHNRPSEIDKALADQAANNDDRLIQLKSSVEKERDEAIAALKKVEIDRDKDKKAADKALKDARAALATASEARKAAVEDWRSILARIDPAREICKSVFVPWQRARSLEMPDNSKAWQCGGQFGIAKGYRKKHDAEHPENIAAAEAAAEVARQAELKHQLEEAEAAKLKVLQQEAANKAAAEAREAIEETHRQRVEHEQQVSDANAAADQDGSAATSDEEPRPNVPPIGADVTDWTAAIMHYQNSPTIRDAIRALALKDMLRGTELDFANPVYPNNG